MTTIDKNRIIGNYGNTLIAHLLSENCLVRQVTEGTDIGVDLYCETIEDWKGFLHFWVQVKSGEQIKIKKNKKATCKFEKRHLEYWNRQPVPVFAFYVRKNEESKVKKIYIANITKYIMYNGLPKKTKRIESDIVIEINKEKWFEEFHDIIKITTTLIQFRDFGIISNIPSIKQEYIRKYPIHLKINKDQINKSIRTIRCTVSSLIISAANAGKDDEMVQNLLEILKLFEKSKRPEVMKALAIWEIDIKNNFKRAKKLIEIAINSINNDINISDEEKIKWIQELETCLLRRSPDSRDEGESESMS